MELLKKRWIKIVVNYGIPTIIAIIGMFGWFKLNTSMKIVFILLSVGLWVILLAFAGYEDKVDREKQAKITELEENNDKLKQVIELLEAENRLHKHTISTANVFSESWARQINAFANDVINKGVVQEASWNRKSLYENVCISCKEAIKKYKGIDRDSDVSVGFIEYSKGESGEEYVELVAHSNLDVGKPTAYENKELVSECSYYYAKIIRDKDIDIKIATNNSEVRNFLSNVSIHTDLSQYEQYILIPVFCSNRKLMGMLQIVTKYGVKIMDEKYHLRQFVDNNIVLYSNLFVLIEKIAKGLYAKPIGGEVVNGKK